MDQSNLFRSKPLERLNSPNREDELFRVTSLKSWLLLVAVFLILIAIILWGLMGTVETSVKGPGIINHPVEIIYSPVEGIIDSIYVQAGDTISESKVLVKVLRNYQISDKGHITITDQSKGWGERPIPPGNAILPGNFNEVGDILVRSPYKGNIIEIRAVTGRFARVSDPLFALQNCHVVDFPPVIFFIDQKHSTRLKSGMGIRMRIMDLRGERIVSGILKSFSPFPASSERLQKVFYDESIAQKLSDKNYIECTGIFNPSGLWARDAIAKNSGRICETEVIIEKTRPVNLIFH